MLLLRYLSWLLLGLGLLTGVPRVVAQDEDYLTHLPDPKTLGETYVSDPDRLLAAATVQQLNARLQALDQSRRAHIDVVLTRSIGDAVPKTAATTLFNRWKIGDAALDNGLLILIVEDQRRVEFETGYGLEADLPDAICFRIQQRHMVPALRQKNYDAAVLDGVEALIEQLTIADSRTPAEARTADSAAWANAGRHLSSPSTKEVNYPTADAAPGTWRTWETIAALLALAFMLVMVLGALTTLRKAPTSYYLILGAGTLLATGLWVGTALLDWPVPLAGLLAVSYGWPLLGAHLYVRAADRHLASMHAESRYNQHVYYAVALHPISLLRYFFPGLGLAGRQQRLAALRNEPYACPGCSHLMHRLSEEQDDAALHPGQATEEYINSNDYDVWQCPQCAHQLPLRYDNLDTKAKACVQCHYQTAQPGADQEMQAATTSHGGWGWHIWNCAFCQYQEKVKYTTARLSESSSSGSSSGRSSSWSSSSGGSSGGGGAGSSW